MLRSAAAARSKLGQYERAIELLIRAIQLEPNNPVNRRMFERAQSNLERSAEQDAP